MINIRFSGYDSSHPEGSVFDEPEGFDCWIILLMHTPTVFLVNDEYKEYGPNCMVLFKPHQGIYYRTCSDSASDDWIWFETDEKYITTTSIPSGEPFIIHDPSYCHKLFQLIATEDILNNKYKDISIDNLLRTLFNKMLESYNCTSRSPLYNSISQLKMEIYRKPNQNWTVSKMAERLNVSAGYLEELYKNTFGVTCMNDVIHSRINLAKKYLIYDSYSIAEIADFCGYRSMEHFFRQFKKHTGVTPNYFRKSSNQFDKQDDIFKL